MKKQELQEKVNAIKWFHRLELPTDEGDIIVTPGIVDHCTEEIATNRYGIPKDLTGKTVLDIGAMNGYHSFLAEKRGANVTAIEPNQGNGDNIFGFKLAKECLKSKINFIPNCDLFSYTRGLGQQMDISFLFGVLYHVINPIELLIDLCSITKEYAIIESAVAQNLNIGRAVWEFNPGFDNDPTNFWYPTIPGLDAALTHIGFTQTELIYYDGIRCTIKAYK